MTTAILLLLIVLYVLSRAHVARLSAARAETACAETLLSLSPAAILVLDDRGDIQRVSQCAARLFGYAPDQLVGKPVSLLTSLDGPADHNHSLDQALRSCTTGGAVCRVAGRCSDESTFPLQLRMRAVQLAGRRCIIAAASDQTADKHMESALARYIHQLLQSKAALHRYTADLEGIVQEQTEALRVACDAAVAANAAKSEFLANMSHELRTPLHGILSFARFGIKKHSFVEREKLLLYFQRIESSGQTLLKLLNALLDLSKLEARAVVLERQSLPLGQLVADIVDELSATLRERNLTADTANIDSEVLVLADRDKLGQVIRNLLGNSLKFTPPGGMITIAVSGSPDGATLEIRDTGPGIPDDDCEHVFDKFVQSRTTQTGAGGTGLGLAICREIVQLHAGRIWAVPTHGSGALLRVELPRWTVLEPAESVTLEAAASESEASILTHASCI